MYQELYYAQDETADAWLNIFRNEGAETLVDALKPHADNGGRVIDHELTGDCYEIGDYTLSVSEEYGFVNLFLNL